jgi:hypothetical protein
VIGGYFGVNNVQRGPIFDLGWCFAAHKILQLFLLRPQLHQTLIVIVSSIGSSNLKHYNKHEQGSTHHEVEDAVLLQMLQPF